MGNSWLKWIVLGVGVYINTFVFAIMFAFGSLLNAMLDKYRANITMTATVQAIFVGVVLSTGIISGILISRFGQWRMSLIGAVLSAAGFIMSFPATSVIHLYISIGVISGSGFSILFISCTAVIGKCFVGPQRLLALAIQNAGVSVGVTLLPYLLTFLLETYGLNGTFLLIGGFYLNLIPGTRMFALVEQTTQVSHHNMTKDDTINKLAVIDTSDSNDSTALCHEHNDTFKSTALFKCIIILRDEYVRLRGDFRNVLSLTFMLSAIAVGLIMASLNGYIALVTDILAWKGLTSAQTLIVFPITYGIGFIARLLPGLVKQLKGVNSFILPLAFSFCGCVGQLIICISDTPSVILVGCAISGLTISGVVSAANILVVQMLEQDNIATGFGFVYTLVGILTVLSGPCYGAIKESSQSYAIVLYLTAAFQFIGMSLFLATMIIRYRQTKVRHSVLTSPSVEDQT